MKIALVHDDLMQSGGAERVVARLHQMWPAAPIYTSVYDASSTLAEFGSADVRTSFLQRTPFASRRLHKLALPLFPAAMESLDLTGFDLVLSSSSRFAKGVLTPPQTCHICYCHTPARFAWRPRDYFGRGRATRMLWPLMMPMLAQLRTWDLDSSSRVDYFIANSHNVADRIQKFYRRDATVIYPPVDTARYTPVAPSEVEDYFLVVSRLVGYKRVDLAVAACSRLGVPLKVVGSGPDEAALRRLAGPTVEFLGKRSDAEVAALYARCKALIFAGEEDFGIVPLEAMASGRPVVAYGVGGALESVIAGTTGVFFEEQTVESMEAALSQVGRIVWDPVALTTHAARFDAHVFEDKIRAFVAEAYAEHQHRFTSGSTVRSGSAVRPFSSAK